jgi:hypothetical protein
MQAMVMPDNAVAAAAMTVVAELLERWIQPAARLRE